MNRLAKWMMRLYPARWRKRYGDELDALLADTGADARVVADLAAGGVRMQFSTWSFPKLALVLGIGGLLLGAAGSFLLAPIYMSKATLQITPVATNESSTQTASMQMNAMIQQMATRVRSRTSLSRVINGLQLYKDELKTTPLEDVIERMRRDIRIEIVALPGDLAKHASAFNISFAYPDPAKARQTVAVLTDRFRQQSELTWRLPPEYAGKHSLFVVDPANLPILPIYPTRRMVALLGFASGLFVAVAWRRFRRKRLLSWWFAVSAVAFGLMGALAADAASFWNLLGNRYRSTALVSVQNSTPEQIQALTREVLSRTSLTTVIYNLNLMLYKDQWKTQPLEDIIDTMRKHLSIAPSGSNGRFLTITFEYGDRIKAMETVSMILNRLVQANLERYRGALDVPVTPLMQGRLEVLDPASVPDGPIKPNRYLVAAAGGVAGLVMAVVIATIRRRWKPEADIPMDAVNG